MTREDILAAGAIVHHLLAYEEVQRELGENANQGAGFGTAREQPRKQWIQIEIENEIVSLSLPLPASSVL